MVRSLTMEEQASAPEKTLVENPMGVMSMHGTHALSRPGR